MCFAHFRLLLRCPTSPSILFFPTAAAFPPSPSSFSSDYQFLSQPSFFSRPLSLRGARVPLVRNAGRRRSEGACEKKKVGSSSIGKSIISPAERAEKSRADIGVSFPPSSR